MENHNDPKSVNVECKEERDSFTAEFDPDSVSPSVAIVKAMAQIQDENPLDLPPLWASTTVDTVALDGLFKPNSGTNLQFSTSVTCTYLGYSIELFSDGSMEIESSTR